MAEIVLRYTMPVYVTIDVAQRRVVCVERSEDEVELDRAGDRPVVLDGEGDAEAAARLAGDVPWPRSRLVRLS